MHSFIPVGLPCGVKSLAVHLPGSATFSFLVVGGVDLGRWKAEGEPLSTRGFPLTPEGPFQKASGKCFSLSTFLGQLYLSFWHVLGHNDAEQAGHTQV